MRNSWIQGKSLPEPGGVWAGGEPSSRAALGERHDNFHHAVQSRPMLPAITKIQRQLKYARITAIRGGATTAPTAVPALIIPMAVARSFVGNHSATTRV